MDSPSNIRGENEQKVPTILFFAATAVIIILAAIVFYLGFLNGGGNTSEVGSSPFNSEAPIQENREVLFDLINESETRALTETERQHIFNELGGSGAVKYQFTDAEKEKILRALNTR